jgi:hypothetical protein
MRRLWLAGLLTVLGCEASSLTEVVITVQAEDNVRKRASQTTLVVTRDPSGAAALVHDDRDSPRNASFARPYVIALSPSEGREDGTYSVEVAALERGIPIATARLISGYVRGQTRYVNVWLEDRCIDVVCAEQQTCRAGSCVAATVEAVQFGSVSKEAPISTDLGESTTASPRPPDAGAPRDESSSEQAPDADAPTPPAEVPNDTPADPLKPQADAGVATPTQPSTPPDAAVPDASLPKPPDTNTSFVCAPVGSWLARRDELPGGSCGSTIAEFPVQFQGKLADPMNAEGDCVLLAVTSDDGCEMSYQHDCPVTDNGESFIERETATIRMTSETTIAGTGDVVLLHPLTYQSLGCSSSVTLAARKP